MVLIATAVLCYNYVIDIFNATRLVDLSAITVQQVLLDSIVFSIKVKASIKSQLL